MTREQFKEYLRYIEDINEFTGKLSEIGIETIDCPQVLYAEDIFFAWLSSEFGENGADVVSWWLYEETEKVLFNEDGTSINVEGIDDLYMYLINNFSK